MQIFKQKEEVHMEKNGFQKKEFIYVIIFPLEENHPTFDEFSIINPIIILDVIKKFCEKKNYV